MAHTQFMETTEIKYDRFDSMTFHVYAGGADRSAWKHVGTVQDGATGDTWYAYTVNGNQVNNTPLTTRRDAAKLLCS